MRKNLLVLAFIFLLASVPFKKKSLKNLNISKKENIFIEDEKNFSLKKDFENIPKKKLV